MGAPATASFRGRGTPPRRLPGLRRGRQRQGSCRVCPRRRSRAEASASARSSPRDLDQGRGARQLPAPARFHGRRTRTAPSRRMLQHNRGVPRALAAWSARGGSVLRSGRPTRGTRWPRGRRRGRPHPRPSWRRTRRGRPEVVAAPPSGAPPARSAPRPRGPARCGSRQRHPASRRPQRPRTLLLQRASVAIPPTVPRPC
mmetsp:Transcript_46283/g.124342  ORF Transcript_46283/g.124342 Transcript_46283/m.124342 type:complete len:200 (+) Transcript_46283:205-804(+)